MAHPQPDSGWIYQCDDIVVEPRAHRLERAGVALSVEPKAFAVLVVLLQQAGEVVGKDELLDAAWGHRHVTPGVLTRVISQLRHTLGDCAGSPRYIATVHTLGYRFIGEVQRTAVPAAAPAEAPDVTAPETRPEVIALPQEATPKRPERPESAPVPWLAAVIMVAAIVAMLAAASVWHPPHDQARSPRSAPQPALVVLPFIHAASTQPPHPRRWPRTRRTATMYLGAHGDPMPSEGGSGYLHARPEQAPAARN
ncbi:winged helix-turn-helix domain-containing protein [Dyella sp. EPa41]|uniref:winged helix-turn-helix domain-containing protein n=1 Tax=Dyella sp. EPa41 TaxID=1561194 RepID=UPI0019160CD3|nr:winged helix-turn-helix domain-containing protein [Dyella sp. EPa41]